MSKQWDNPKTATVKFNVAMTENGTIAQSGDSASGNKSFSMAGIKTSADLATTKSVYSAFVEGLAGGRYDESSGEKLVKYKVVEVE